MGHLERPPDGEPLRRERRPGAGGDSQTTIIRQRQTALDSAPAPRRQAPRPSPRLFRIARALLSPSRPR
jgi:hypothetical protein